MFCVYRSRTERIYDNDESAQRSNYPGNPVSLAPLHYERDQSAANQNRYQATTAAARDGLVCPGMDQLGRKDEMDEYPFARSKEGGFYNGRYAQVRCVPYVEQRAQAGDYGIFVVAELARVDNAPFWVLPVPY